MSTFKEADLAARTSEVIRRAREDGAVLIECADGSQLTLRLTHKRESTNASPLNVGTVSNLHLGLDEIVDLVRESRERSAH